MAKPDTKQLTECVRGLLAACNSLLFEWDQADEELEGVRELDRSFVPQMRKEVAKAEKALKQSRPK